MTIGLLTGCFDLIHPGHINLIQAAANHLRVRCGVGQRCEGPRLLIVGINDDASVSGLKGSSRPLLPFACRATVVRAIDGVDFVVPIGAQRVNDLLYAVRPQFWYKGGDYTIDTLDRGEVATAKEIGAEIVILPSVPGWSTTGLEARLRDRLDIDHR